MTDPPEIPDQRGPDSLTCILPAYTLGCTNEPESEEMNKVIVKNFIDTLAEVSISIAKRKVQEKE